MTTLRDLSTPVAALALLMAGHPNLPAPDINANPIYPERLRLSFHGEPFDVWLTALGIDPETVHAYTQSDGQTHVRRATARYGGADIELVEFNDTKPGEQQ